jgi:protein arginine kinase activator
MKCDFCNNKATVFLTQLIEGQMKKVCLCDDCARERGVTDPTGFSLADLLLGGIGGTGTGTTVQTKIRTAGQGAGRKCPSCGFTLDDLRKVRRFGCADCYTTFSEEVAQILHGMHKGGSHVGKVPAGSMARQALRQRLDELRSRLDQAVTSESYEEAAGIRDEIRKLETTAPT